MQSTLIRKNTKARTPPVRSSSAATIRRTLWHGALFAALSVTLPAAHAQAGASEASALSALPIAVSVAAPVMLFSAGAVLTVVAVEASAAGTVCILERASDGARASVRLGAQVVGGLSVAAGTALVVTAMSTGWVLSAASQVVAFIPNEVGATLLYNERVSR